MVKCMRALVPAMLAGAMILAASCGKVSCKTAPEADSSDFVNLTDVVPDAILEIRYFSTFNFVGARIDGYLQPTALPQCAVDHFVRWSLDPADTVMKSRFYPMLDKPVLFEQDYIMAKSGHTRGSTVDLTLFDMASEKELDMGGTFDWFGEESHPDYCGDAESETYIPSGGLTEEQFRNRMILRAAMKRHGFLPLESEWWHFRLADEPYPDTYFTFPVRELNPKRCK